MKSIKLSLVAILLSTLAYAENKSEVGMSANVALTSDYVWRGTSLTAGDMAIQGGMDLDFEGAYIGVWASNIAQLTVDVNDNTTTIETDVYAGYAGDIGKLSYDVGYNQYIYINLSEEFNFGEFYVGLGYDFDVVSIGAKYSVGIKTNEFEATDNLEMTASAPLPWELSLDLTYGLFEDMNDYYLASISRDFGKFNLNLAYAGRLSASYGDSYYENDIEGDESKDFFIATLGASF